MNYFQFLNTIINDGIEAVQKNYANDLNKLQGAITGFESCRGKEAKDLIEVLGTVQEYSRDAYRMRADNYWYFRCYEVEVEWVCNVVSAFLMKNNQKPLLKHLPTVAGWRKALKILGQI